ncbi:hypothetical protein BO78DRAFT_403243 [Aspergillus sclerotiicarbonarius CBS 121057]|uniref:S-adenosyl-L-methionine-dependent methyltransferase n=1 Tax=Aspergillus sclerotiicarbonarius (strain CBS 121057 / IBT 28362) TaxID=1448318 RepID=A0A319ELP6_ASPSB|nr:hypothetical protein BO78DRAFT_403243 [Aspergillus sclerotiicarbonarius CBS 121057]
MRENGHAVDDKIPKDNSVPQLPTANGWNGTIIGPKDSYALMRDCNASSRLTAQHYLWKDLLGFLVHPDIDTRATDLRVADVATGNGIWLHDFARGKPPSVDLHGFDTSLDQVGPKQWLPANIHMHIWDMFENVPDEFVGYFDIVHVRLITVVVKNNDPRPILANLNRLLKPGGYLQWDEVDTIGCSIKTVPGISACNLNALFSQLKGHDTWYGLGMARFWTHVYMSTWKEFAESALKTPEASRRLEHNAMIETLNGAAIIVPKLVWVTKKIDTTD